MKRSLTVTLVLMGGSALSGCGGSEVDTAVFNDVRQCIESGQFTAEKCETDFKKALASHWDTAPAYTTQADCEVEFGIGKCQENAAAEPAQNSPATHHSYFMPVMMGYMMGSMMANGQRAVPPQALYKPQARAGYYNANGARVSQSVGPVQFSSKSAAAQAPKTRTTTMARGGFGARASAVSS